MKKITISLLFLLSTLPVFAAPSPVKFDIYPNSAVVTFTAEVNNQDTLLIPGAFNPKSVQIVSVNGADLVFFNAETMYGDSEPPYYLLNAKKELDSLNKSLSLKLAKLSALDLAAAVLDGLNADNVKPAELTLFLANLSGLREKNANDLQSVNDEIKSLKEQIKLKQDNYDKKLPKNYNENTAINVKLSGKGYVTFEAQTNGASWQPKYNMNLNTKTGLITTTFSVAVKQNTGMKWQGSMEFYSSQPLKNLYYRKLSPLAAYLEKNMPVPEPRAQSMQVKSAKSLAMNEMADEMEVATPPQITDAGLYFKINGTVQGDGTNSGLPVEKFNIQSQAGFEITPEFSRYALLTANVKNMPKPMLHANAELFIDGKYSASTFIESAPQGKELTILFGESKNITATKTDVISKNQSSWIKGAMTGGYTIDILNGLDRNIILTVNDRIPYPADNKISVTNIVINPKTAEPTEGIYKWEMTLKPKETKKISVNYEIKYPSDDRIFFR